MYKKKQQQQKLFLKITFFFRDTEYRKFLSESYEYEYEEYPDQDNYGSNKPQDIKKDFNKVNYTSNN